MGKKKWRTNEGGRDGSGISAVMGGKVAMKSTGYPPIGP